VGSFALVKGWKKWLLLQLQGDCVYSTGLYASSLALVWLECAHRSFVFVYVASLMHWASLAWITANTLPALKKCATFAAKIAKGLGKCVYSGCESLAKRVG
jgi:hypothetical protein